MKKSYYFYTNGTLRRHDSTLQFVATDETKRDIPIERITDLYIMSEMSLNSTLFNFLGTYGVNVHFFNYYSFYTGSFFARDKLPAGDLLVKQVEHYTDEAKRLTLARGIVEAASANIYRNLRYYNGRGKDVSQEMNQILLFKGKLAGAKDVTELMGFEGLIHKIYYDAWNKIVDQTIDFTKRVKRPPDNMINTLISFMNSLIYTKVLSEIYHTQLNPTISYLHVPGTRRYSLCLDIAEIFKPLLGDRLIFSLLNRNQITPDSFTKELNGLHLTKTASQTIVHNLDERLNTTIYHKELEKQVSYQYLMRLECYRLIKHLLGEKLYEGFQIWW